jgi:hypothetical protein
MNCSQVRELISALHDRELRPEVEAEVNDHLRGCPECSRLLSEFGDLSILAASLRNVSMVAPDWATIEAAIDDQSWSHSPLWRWASSHAATIAIAAAVFIAATVGISVYIFRSDHHGHEHVAVHFGQYLDEFDRNPDRAEQVLLVNYAGQPVTLDEAARHLKYQPVAPEGLPKGFTRNRVYLLKMPCCLCVQSIYSDAAGRTMAVFEHIDDQPAWFGDRPTMTVQCHGLATCLVQVDGKLAASWKRQKRVITLIGARDLEEVSQFVEFLNEPEPQADASDQASNCTFDCRCNHSAGLLIAHSNFVLRNAANSRPSRHHLQ